jgi:hypothetical protein
VRAEAAFSKAFRSCASCLPIASLRSYGALLSVSRSSAASAWHSSSRGCLILSAGKAAMRSSTRLLIELTRLSNSWYPTSAQIALLNTFGFARLFMRLRDRSCIFAHIASMDALKSDSVARRLRPSDFCLASLNSARICSSASRATSVLSLEKGGSSSSLMLLRPAASPH